MRIRTVVLSWVGITVMAVILARAYFPDRGAWRAETTVIECFQVQKDGTPVDATMMLGESGLQGDNLETWCKVDRTPSDGSAVTVFDNTWRRVVMQ